MKSNMTITEARAAVKVAQDTYTEVIRTSNKEALASLTAEAEANKHNSKYDIEAAELYYTSETENAKFEAAQINYMQAVHNLQQCLQNTVENEELK